jgi:tetraacyldisaccharide 4'-kinase
MDDAQIKFYPILQPFAFLYQTGVALRNFCFDRCLLPSVCYSIPVICVGNLAVGGTGKTPLVEYLIRLLSDKFRVAVLSRGYKRKSTGYVLADANSTSLDIGDEACQIKFKFPHVVVAVDKKRRRGMQNLLELPKDIRPQVVILDDGFQHRSVKPSLSMIVTDYNRRFWKDKMLPVGRLREPAKAIVRADMLLISKCPDKINETEIWQQLPDALRVQDIFFSQIEYQPPKNVFSIPNQIDKLDRIRNKDHVLLITGIANPAPLIAEVKRYTDNVRVLIFGDHHAFTKQDIRKMQSELSQMKSDNPLIVCTEKDAARIRHHQHIPDEWKSRLYYIPIQIRILPNQQKTMDEIILQHVTSFASSEEA